MVNLSYKFRIYPNSEQETILKKTVGCCRFVYNYALGLSKETWKNDKKSTSYVQSSAAITELRRQVETKWLRDVSSVALQQSLRNLDNAFTNLFKHGGGYPKFKKRKNGGSARFVKTGFRLKNNLFYVAKIKTPIKVAWSRELPSPPSSCTISLNPSGQWFVCFTCETSVEKLSPSDRNVSIDLGIETFVTFSNGTKIKQPKSIRTLRKKLARTQSSKDRKKLGSRNYEKARIKVAKVHQKIFNIRQDFLHKLSSSIIRENQTIAIEDLAVSKMVKNRRLARLISEQGWRQFRTMLEYKANWYGRELIVIDRFFPSSQICNSCGKTNKLTLDKRKFTCECGVTYDRDVNAAKNILAVGTTVSACGVDGRPISNRQLTVKQEVLLERAG